MTLHFNCDDGGGDVVILTGNADLEGEFPASAQPGFLERYEKTITGSLKMTVAEFDSTYSFRIRFRPDRVVSYVAE